MVRSVQQLRSDVACARAAGRRVGLVPTMGALHEGHLSLVQAARDECDMTIVSIFVNPTQFGPHEDFDRYPRTMERDLPLLRRVGADLVFAPDRQTIYPEGFSTYVDPPAVGQPWEGQCRPGHFRGVATVVLKLFNLAGADVAYFGRKDYQQARVIQCMVEDLAVPIAVRVCPTVRESDGLALSSRNRYLDADQRERALALWKSLLLARQLVQGGERQAESINGRMQQRLIELGVDRIDYAALVDPVTLQPVARVQQRTVALVAAFVGQTRLIDNLEIEPCSS
ncbi:MAG: pantoate--beta-alanine ligase [Planctomycetaceae bacterium]|nr:MAG: pantoate--beta-alanine ligase [Planctomycetaceae bacterium]